MWLHAEPSLRHLDRLHTAALALCGGDPHDADDLVQDVYLSLLRRPRKLTGGSELAYLLTMLRNRYIDGHRAARRRNTSGPLEEHDEPAARDRLSPELAVEYSQVLAAVARLDSPFREALVAVDVCGLSYREAATALSAPVGTVMSRLARARARLIREVEGVAVA